MTNLRRGSAKPTKMTRDWLRSIKTNERLKVASTKKTSETAHTFIAKHELTWSSFHLTRRSSESNSIRTTVPEWKPAKDSVFWGVVAARRDSRNWVSQCHGKTSCATAWTLENWCTSLGLGSLVRTKLCSKQKLTNCGTGILTFRTQDADAKQPA